MEFFYFFGDGVGMSGIGGGRGVSRSGETNPSAAGSGICFEGAVLVKINRRIVSRTRIIGFIIMRM